MLADRGPRLDGELWYHGNIGRTDAHARLSRHGAGTFLVRSKGGSKPGKAVEVLHSQCVLSLKVEWFHADYAEAVVHFLITRAQPDPTNDNVYANATPCVAGLYSLVGKPWVKRPTIQALIEAYAAIPPAKRLGTLLTTPCPCPGATPCASPNAGTPPLSPTVAPRNFGLDASAVPRSSRLSPLSDTDVFPPAACEPAAVDRHAHLSSSPPPRRSSLTSPASPGLRANNLRAFHKSGGSTSGDGGSSRRASGKYW